MVCRARSVEVRVSVENGGSSEDGGSSPGSDPTVSRMGTTHFRGLAASDILYSGRKLQWTAQDKKQMNMFSARHKIARNVKPCDIGDLLHTFGFVGHSEEVDKKLAQKTANAVKYNLITKLTFVKHITLNGKPAAYWPTWTERWYTDPNWNGDTTNPAEPSLEQLLESASVPASTSTTLADAPVARVGDRLQVTRLPAVASASRPSPYQEVIVVPASVVPVPLAPASAAVQLTPVGPHTTTAPTIASAGNYQLQAPITVHDPTTCPEVPLLHVPAEEALTARRTTHQPPSTATTPHQSHPEHYYQAHFIPHSGHLAHPTTSPSVNGAYAPYPSPPPEADTQHRCAPDPDRSLAQQSAVAPSGLYVGMTQPSIAVQQPRVMMRQPHVMMQPPRITVQQPRATPQQLHTAEAQQQHPIAAQQQLHTAQPLPTAQLLPTAQQSSTTAQQHHPFAAPHQHPTAAQQQLYTALPLPTAQQPHPEAQHSPSTAHPPPPPPPAPTAPANPFKRVYDMRTAPAGRARGTDIDELIAAADRAKAASVDVVAARAGAAGVSVGDGEGEGEGGGVGAGAGAGAGVAPAPSGSS